MATESTPRAQARIRTQQRILELGREHLAQYGAASLSLRAIARDLEMVSSAVYRYVASRDDLLTMLVVDAYTELGDQVAAAQRQIPAHDHREQIQVSCQAFHDWAVSEPARYALLYGSPVPGYQAPAEQTTEPGIRVIGLLLRAFAAAEAAGQINAPAGRAGTATAIDFDATRTEFGLTLTEENMHSAIALWALTVGLTSLEVFGQFGAEPPFDLQALFTVEVGGLLDKIGLTHPR